MAVFNINELPILAQYQFAENDKEKFQGVNKFNKAFWVEDDRVDDFTKYLLNECVYRRTWSPKSETLGQFI